MTPMILLILLLTGATALAQVAPPPTAASAAPMATVAATAGLRAKDKPVVRPTSPVITIHGLCGRRGKSKQDWKAGSCHAVLTRRQFEELLDVLRATAPDLGPAAYRKIAQVYTSLLVNAEAGRKAGVDKDPRFEQIFDMTRLRALSDMYRVRLQKEARQISPGDIEAYYNKHIDSYEEVSLDRLVLPKNNQANLSDPDFRAKVSRLAGELHARAVKGEEINALQREGLQALGIKDPPVSSISVRRGQLNAKADAEVFALQHGEVTSLLDTPAVWLFYKRNGRRTLPLQKVKNEIAAKLYRDKVDTLEKTLFESVNAEYNEAYFATRSTADNVAVRTADNQVEAEEKSAGHAAVGPSDAVMTIHGLCARHGQKSESKPGSCTTIITRRQLDTALNVARLTPHPVPPSLREIAEAYLDLLVYGNAAEKAGTDQDPRFRRVLQLARNRALSDMYYVKLDEQAHQLSAKEIENYYKNHLANFEEVQLRHISVPKEKPGKLYGATDHFKAKRLADELRERAAKGEDMDKLQQEAYQILGVKDHLATLMRPLRRDSFEESTTREIFALKPGQVMPVRELPTAYVIYKLESRTTIPLVEAKTEISQTLYREKLERLTKALTHSVRAEYNENYFAPASSTGWASAGSQASALRMPASPN